MTRTRRTMIGARSPRRGRLDPLREIRIDIVVDGPAKGWVHTHGLAAHGKPELEIRNVPLFLRGAATGLLNDLADYLLNDAARPLLAGERVTWGNAEIQVLEAHADDDAGYDAGHYAGGARLVLVDADGVCRCEECAREAAEAARH